MSERITAYLNRRREAGISDETLETMTGISTNKLARWHNGNFGRVTEAEDRIFGILEFLETHPSGGLLHNEYVQKAHSVVERRKQLIKEIKW